ncbi:ECF transporter S component [Marinilactibacillus sp. 15R]|uniref:Riboflavin transporter n=1 Tax=Marinilactibacillus piezotolerans TaxID=258723 RepID=A0A1I3VSY8_9LACT|nr:MULTISPECIES: ECF transporter S component [Marinilactibacillus]API89298.1 ECF transporter S component [Marinilactibacillus sp. 15R]SFJ97407.1 Riboflavin transporter FmnP [Marinilactibacillus piezotolerans]
MSNIKTHKTVGIAILASLAWIISMFAFPILPASSFLKIDFSDLPILFGMYVYGPAGGVIIAFIRSLLSFVQKGGEAGLPIGDTAQFVASLSFTLPIYLIITKFGLKLKEKIVASTLGTITLSIVMALLNWFFLVPAYMAVMGFEVGPLSEYLLLAIVPFNLIKGTIVSVIFFVAFQKLYPWLEKSRKRLYKNHSRTAVLNNDKLI